MLNGFVFKEFSIRHDRCAMKVGTDGVLLGAWACGGDRILDIGSGSGLVAMMMAQRFHHAMIEGIEIDGDAVQQSCENAEQSVFAKQLRFYHGDLRTWQPQHPFDAMVTNPPFFLNSLNAPDKSRAMARNAEFLPFADIFSFASRWLVKTGCLSAIVPVEAYELFAAEAALQGFFIERLYHVKPSLRKPVRRCLVSFTRLRPEMYDEKTVVLSRPDGSRSEWYAALTRNFYIK